MNTITKVGLAIIKDKKLLIVRKEGTTKFLVPGGRPENSENEVETLQREIMEELNCDLDLNSLQYIGEFADIAANEPNTIIKVKLYSGTVSGSMVASSEIEEIRWFNPQSDDMEILAPSIKNKIVPGLLESHHL
jgi:8-oxo-dGTP diphosphatase